MRKNWRFVFQANQFWGECLPCTLYDFNTIVDSAQVAWSIATRQDVDKAIREGGSLDRWTHRSDFQQYCLYQEGRPEKGEAFRQLTMEEKLLRWTNFIKMSLPCFIFSAFAFDLLPITDKLNNPVLDADGNPILRRRRLLKGIHLNGLFMFDADHLTIDPYEVFMRTQVLGFPWKIYLGHKTSSGQGLRLVAEVKPELGNIADNQICLARDLRLMGVKGSTGKPVVDDSCIDASRISYAPRRQDIYYIDEEHLFSA